MEELKLKPDSFTGEWTGLRIWALEPLFVLAIYEVE